MKIKQMKVFGIVFSLLMILATVVGYFTIGRLERNFSKSLIFEFEIKETISNLKNFEDIAKNVTLCKEVEVSKRDNNVLIVKTPLLSTQIAESLINNIDTAISVTELPDIQSEQDIIETVQENASDFVYYDTENATTVVQDENGNVVEGKEREKVLESLDGQAPQYKTNPLNISDEVYEKALAVRMVDEGINAFITYKNGIILVLIGFLISLIFMVIRYKELCGLKLIIVELVNIIFAVVIAGLSMILSNRAIGEDFVLVSLLNVMYSLYTSIVLYEIYRKNILNKKKKDTKEDLADKTILEVLPKVKKSVIMFLFIGVAIVIVAMLKNYMVILENLLPVIISLILLEITSIFVTLPLIYAFSKGAKEK